MVWFCAGDPAAGGRLLTTQGTGPIMPSATWNERTSVEVKAREKEIFMVIDPQGQLKHADWSLFKAY